ncbi:putative ABC transporter ATP-binding protein YbhF [Caloramator mitchellensis]|uniref:Putative ABC transporter ATP-binding protein YbhF n=1 Tax=Caloramator mitchellensis TaxID=908809 RepID=A0A0R3JRI7_CALMK|nr:ATP-binding cassette domain-containing protein [Caloramator mitchellensis]KRQ86099.1 putative ABC transporter ATP-binding protein YbhF [Caloramator mitchellensis]
MGIICVKDLKKEFIISKRKGFLTREYKRIEAVKGISFEVEEGQMLAFIGPNGAGKSTTIKMLTGILNPTSGYSNVLGLDPQKDRKKLAYGIGTVFGQKSQLWFHLPPKDTFELLGNIYGIEGLELNKRVEYLSEVLEIKELLDIPVRKMSLGQRIKCEIAASLLHRPKVIFLDEPTIGLDVVAKKNLRSLIKRINQEEKTTIFLTSHDIGDIEKLCKRIIIINLGTILMDDSVKKLKYKYDNKKIISLRYTDDIEFNLEGAKVLSQTTNAVRIEVDTEDNDIDETVAKLFKIGKVEDISISSRPLEEIIADIYSLRGEGE